VAKIVRAADRDEAVDALREYAHAGDIVLVKGSRSEQLERIIEALSAA
jgi:UDP-N-acetylmuramyl pentapeptide synthase